MKKKVLVLRRVTALLLLVGWSQIGKALATQETNTVVIANPRLEVPDYPADGKLFNDLYRSNKPSGIIQEAPDYRLDAEFFSEWYRDGSRSSQNQGIPDYPLDGKVFVDHYTVLP
jgi:hypothetical protein